MLSKVELSFAYPFLSLAYVAVAVFAYFVFREDLNAWRIAGIAFIISGAAAAITAAERTAAAERRARIMAGFRCLTAARVRRSPLGLK